VIILSLINHSYNRIVDSPLYYSSTSFPSPLWSFTLCLHRVSLNHTSKQQENNFPSSRAYLPLSPSAHTRHEEPSLVLLHVGATCQQILIIITCKIHVL